jgi:hypothetical protein
VRSDGLANLPTEREHDAEISAGRAQWSAPNWPDGRKNSETHKA